MGMFDDIAYMMRCPICGNSLKDWQSKSGHCVLAAELKPADLWEQGDGPSVNFYDNCDSCGTWVDVRLSPGTLPWTHDEIRAHAQGERPPVKRGPVIPEVDK